MHRLRRNRKQCAFILVLVIVFLAVFAALVPAYAAHDGTSHPPEDAPASTDAPINNPAAGLDDGSSVIAPILTAILLFVGKLMGNLLTVMVSGVIAVSEYNDFINSLAVVNGWVIVRDVANMFFIVVLLIIAFGTILGQEDYHYKKLLPKMLILAVLVNFSRTIVGVMIDFAQVIMLTFVNGYKAAAGGNFAAIFQIVELLKFDREACEGTGNASGAPTEWGIFMAALLAFIMITVSIITMSVILAVLILRVITLWVLIVLSPMAFLAGTFPQGQKYYTQWWEEFKNNVMVGPLLAFFLWLSLVTVGSGNSAALLGAAAPPPEGEIKFACSQVGSTSSIISFIIGNMMLLVGVQMAQQMGGAIAGIASQARSAATRALKFGAKAMAAPVMLGGGLAARRTQRALLDWSAVEKPGAGLKGLFRRGVKYAVAPGQAFSGFMQRGKRLNEQSRQRAFAAAQEEADFMFTGGLWGKQAVRNPWLRLARDTQRGHEVQQMKGLRRQDQVAVAKRLVGRKDTLGSTEYEDAREAI